LSYGGRTHVVLPLFYYVLAGFSLFFDTMLVAKVIPNVLASALIFVVFLIVRYMTRDDEIAVLAAFVGGFIPVFVSETINSISAYTITVPLSFLMLYFLLKRHLNLFLISVCVFVLTSPSIVVVVLGMLLYFIFSWVEGFKPARAEVELTVFAVFLVTWFYLVFYRGALLLHGHRIIWSNIPGEVIVKYFSQVDLLTALSLIGIIPILSGIIVLYHYLFKQKKRSVYLLVSFLVIVALLLLLRFIQLKIGLIYIGVLLAILFGEFLMLFKSYIAKTKIVKFKYYLALVFFLVFVLTSVVPSIGSARQVQAESISKERVFAYSFLQNLSISSDTFVGTVFEGNLINYYIERKNVIDTDFLMIEDTSARLRDIRTIYTSAIESKPVELMKKYKADYIIFSTEAMDYYNISKIAYVDDECFPLVYSSREVKAYQRKC